MNTIDTTRAAAAVTTTGTPERYSRLHKWATGATRRLELQAQADMALAAVERAVVAIYEELPGVGRINVHSDGRVRIPLPWGKHDAHWGLNKAQRELVRALLFSAIRSHGKGNGPAPVFIFDDARRGWLVNVGDYSTQHAAAGWLAWARQNWNPATIEAALRWLQGHSPDGSKRGVKAGTGEGSGRALG